VSRRTGAALGLAGLVALAVAADAGVKGFGATPEMARASVALIVLVAVAGYGPARALVPEGMQGSFPVLVPLVGTATAGLGLTLLGFLGVPWAASLPLLLVAGVAGAVLARMRLGPVECPPAGRELAAALVVAALLALLAMVPAFRDGTATVYGTNPDGHLSVGAAEFLQHARPEQVDASLPVDRMPLVWRSKYPIYYVLAATASLSGLTPVEAFTAVGAVLAALTALAFYLLARHAFRAPPPAALLAMGAVGADRLLTHLSLHPYYNQLWGTLALPLMLLFGWRMITERDPRSAALFALFAVLGVLAYPLMALFPVLAIAAAAVVAARRGDLGLRRVGLPVGAGRRVLTGLGVVVAIPAALVLFRGVAEKSDSAKDVILPGRSLAAWGGDLTAYPSLGSFFGAPAPSAAPGAVGGLPVWIGGVVAMAVIAAALASLPRMPRPVAAGVAATLAGGLGLALYFRLRTGGEYFAFKLLAFTAPVAISAAAVWLAGVWESPRTPLALAAGGAAVVWLGVSVLGLRQEVRNTGQQLTPQLRALGRAADRLPAGSSMRLDIPPDGAQLWAGYVLASHPLSSPNPILGTTYPHVPGGRKVDFIVADTRLGLQPWPDASGPPLFDDGAYRIYRMDPHIKGPDLSSQTMQEGLGAALQ